MNPNRQAKKILKLYGKAEYQARVTYVKGFLEEEPSFVSGISWKHLGKRCLLIALILTLTLALLVTAASAFGIGLTGFNLFDWNDHTEITRNEEEALAENTQFYELGYMPQGYTLVNTDQFADVRIDRVYEDEAGNLLYIEQCKEDSFSANIDNEDCVRDRMDIDGTEVMIYRYHNGSALYMMNRQGIVIAVSGVIDEEEYRNIIDGLKQ